jgi:hypothetical protein
VKNPGLARRYQKACPHAVYGDLCKAVRTHEVVSLQSSEDGLLVVSIPVTGYIEAASYGGGLLTVGLAGGETRYETIVDAQEADGALHLRFNGSLVGQAISSIKISKGCNHTEAACSSWHDNINNHGGFTAMPDSSPINKLTTFY